MLAPVYVIAEVGVNHNGSLALAEELVDVAHKCGADAVKFQTFRADKVATATAVKAAYQQVGTQAGLTQLEMLRDLELPPADHLQLFNRCQELGIEFLSTPFDFGSVDLLDEMGASKFKIGSGDLTNIPLLKYVAQKGKPIILSTGMSTLEEVQEAVDSIRSVSQVPVTLLHCLSQYPAPVEEVNLRAMDTLRSELMLPVGYSDHTPGIDIAVAAVALGAEIIEKHITLDRSMPGPDHSASLEPDEFQDMVRSIRRVSSALGDGNKVPARSEMESRVVARRSLVAAKNLNAGDVIQPDDIAIKRPGEGIAPRDYDVVIGKTLLKNVRSDEVLTWDILN